MALMSLFASHRMVYSVSASHAPFIEVVTFAGSALPRPGGTSVTLQAPRQHLLMAFPAHVASRLQVCAVRQTGAFAEQAVVPAPAAWRVPGEWPARSSDRHQQSSNPCSARQCGACGHRLARMGHLDASFDGSYWPCTPTHAPCRPFSLCVPVTLALTPEHAPTAVLMGPCRGSGAGGCRRHPHRVRHG